MRHIPVKLRNIKASVPAFIDDEDFSKVMKHKWYVDECGKNSYARTFISYKSKSGWRTRSCSMHRMLLKPPEKFDVDHINGNGLDNRRSNLRICTREQNLRNRKINKTKGVKGVHWHETAEKWCAQITHNGKCQHIGLFQDRDEAAKAYDNKAKELFGEFANLNFPI